MWYKWAIADGNWSDPGIWNEGVVPSPTDYVYLNGKCVTIAGHVAARSLRANAVPALGIVAGGELVFAPHSVLDPYGGAESTCTQDPIIQEICESDGTTERS